MVTYRHIDNSLIIITECMTLRGDVLSTKNKDFLNLKIENDSKNSYRLLQ